jgi:hypothetical protein
MRRRREPWGEFSFLLNCPSTLKSDYPELGYGGRQSPTPLSGPVRSRRPLKIVGTEWILRQFVQRTAAGLQGEQPLVDATM